VCYSSFCFFRDTLHFATLQCATLHFVKGMIVNWMFFLGVTECGTQEDKVSMKWKDPSFSLFQNSRFEVWGIALELALQWWPRPLEPDWVTWILWRFHYSFDHLMFTPQRMNDCRHLMFFFVVVVVLYLEQKFTNLIEDETKRIGIYAWVKSFISVQLRSSVVA